MRILEAVARTLPVRPRYRAAFVVGVLAAGAASGGLAMATAGGAKRGPALPTIYQPGLPQALAPVATVPAGIVRSFAVFRRARTSADQPPTDIVDHDVISRGGNPNLARLATLLTASPFTSYLQAAGCVS